MVVEIFASCICSQLDKHIKEDTVYLFTLHNNVMNELDISAGTCPVLCIFKKHVLIFYTRHA